jgi:hypothetical protein
VSEVLAVSVIMIIDLSAEAAITGMSSSTSAANEKSAAKDV